VRNVYRILGRPVPDGLLMSNISTGSPGQAVAEPVALLTPTIDGEETSYFEWLGAGRFEVREVAGAMHRASRRRPILAAVLFAFDEGRLYLRLDGIIPLAEALATGLEISVEFLKPAGVRFSIRETSGRPVGAFLDRRGDPPSWHERRTAEPALAVRSVVEVGLPLAELVRPQGPRDLQLFVVVRDRGGVEVEQHPTQQPLTMTAPDSRFESLHWRV
jgi:hypothetical protein